MSVLWSLASVGFQLGFIVLVASGAHAVQRAIERRHDREDEKRKRSV